jgi:glycosyltransferase involved in cell wall biosynthesis
MTPAGARRVAFVMHGFSGGGMERSMLRLAEAFLARGLAVDFAVGQAGGELLGDVPAAARVIELAKVPLWRGLALAMAAEPATRGLVLGLDLKPLKRLVRRLPSLVAYLRATRPDAILAAEPRYNAIAVWGRRLSGLESNVVISERIHGSRHAALGGPWGEPGLHDLLRRAYLQADAIVAVSDGVADDLAAHTKIPRERITTVYNPVVGPELAAKAQEPLDHPWFAPGAPPAILAAGRLDPQKDFATLIRAFARLRAKRPARLLILGAASRAQPDHLQELEALAATLGIAQDVAMPGYVHNPFAYMARASVFVLSSRYEGLPGALIQALACGCPAVSTDCPSGPAEILDHGRFGPLVPVGDDAALASVIEQVLQEPRSAEQLHARAELFTVRRAVDNYLKLLFAAGSKPSGRAAACRSVPEASKVPRAESRSDTSLIDDRAHYTRAVTPPETTGSRICRAASLGR